MSEDRVRQSLDALAQLAQNTAAQAGTVVELAARFEAALKAGGTLYFAGNGGSAADAQHLATEYVVRFNQERQAIPAVALTTDTSILTAAANDFGFEEIFARQVEAFCRPPDLLILHSTSGSSPNLIRAAETAGAKGVTVIALLGRDGGALVDFVDQALIVESDDTSQIQEMQLALQHIIVALVEEGLASP